LNFDPAPSYITGLPSDMAPSSSIARNGSSTGVTVLTASVAKKISAKVSSAGSKQYVVDVANNILGVKKDIDDPQKSSYKARSLGVLNMYTNLDPDDNTGQKSATAALLKQYREQLLSNQSMDEYERLTCETALIQECRNALKAGETDNVQALLTKYSSSVQNTDNKRNLLMTELALNERLGNYQKAMDVLQSVKLLKPDVERVKKGFKQPLYNMIEERLQAKAKEAGIVLDTTHNVQVPSLAPTVMVLLQNYPNPFNPTTQIQYQLTQSSRVTLKVYDVLGREVALLRDGTQETGYHSVTFNGSKLASGIYFTRLIVNGQDGKQIVQTKKMLMMK